MAKTLRAWVAPASHPHESKSVLGKCTDAILADLDVEKLRNSFDKLSGDIKDIFAGAAQGDAACRLKEISVGVEISAEGAVTLIGSLSAGGKASITLTFERS